MLENCQTYFKDQDFKVRLTFSKITEERVKFRDHP